MLDVRCFDQSDNAVAVGRVFSFGEDNWSKDLRYLLPPSFGYTSHHGHTVLRIRSDRHRRLPSVGNSAPNESLRSRQDSWGLGRLSSRYYGTPGVGNLELGHAGTKVKGNVALPRLRKRVI